MPKPQRLCHLCKRVAVTGSRSCNFHARQLRAERSRRAVEVRLIPFLPENRNLDGIIEELISDPNAYGQVDAATIARVADSVTRAIYSNRIDAKRARLFLYSLQLSRNLRRQTTPTDPHLPAASLALENLTLALNSFKGRGNSVKSLGKGTTSVVPDKDEKMMGFSP